MDFRGIVSKQLESRGARSVAFGRGSPERAKENLNEGARDTNPTSVKITQSGTRAADQELSKRGTIFLQGKTFLF